MRRSTVDSRKLLYSKWTAIEPRDREKHFVVNRIFQIDTSGSTSVNVELEAVLSKRVRSLPLNELFDTTRWTQGWSRSSDAD